MAAASGLWICGRVPTRLEEGPPHLFPYWGGLHDTTLIKGGGKGGWGKENEITANSNRVGGHHDHTKKLNWIGLCHSPSFFGKQTPIFLCQSFQPNQLPPNSSNSLCAFHFSLKNPHTLHQRGKK